nr:MAG TPA: acriflavine resistance protein B [Inoviridae sp.]
MFRFVETFHHFFAFCLSVFWILLVKHQRKSRKTSERKKT